MERAGYSRKQLKETAATFVDALASAVKAPRASGTSGYFAWGCFRYFSRERPQAATDRRKSSMASTISSGVCTDM